MRCLLLSANKARQRESREAEATLFGSVAPRCFCWCCFSCSLRVNARSDQVPEARPSVGSLRLISARRMAAAVRNRQVQRKCPVRILNSEAAVRDTPGSCCHYLHGERSDCERCKICGWRSPHHISCHGRCSCWMLANALFTRVMACSHRMVSYSQTPGRLRFCNRHNIAVE